MSRIIKPSLAEIADGRYRHHPRYRGCVGHWLMTEGGGTALYDVSGYNSRGVVTGATWTSGIHGPTLSFNGTTNYVNVPASTHLDSLTSKISLSAWVKQSTLPTTTYRSIIYKGSAAEIALDVDTVTFGNGYRFVLLDATNYRIVQTNTAAVAGVWEHICGICDGTTLRIYRNGIQQTGTATLTSALVSHANDPLAIGAWNDGATVTRYLDGMIDDVRIYNRALTPGEILSLYQDPFLEFEPLEQIVRWFLPPIGTTLIERRTDTATRIIKPSLAEIADGRYRQHPRYQGCIGHWMMNENGGIGLFNLAMPSSTVLTDTTWISGRRGSALSFNGTTSQAVADDMAGFAKDNRQGSVSAWVKYNAYGGTILCFGMNGTSSYLMIRAPSTSFDIEIRTDSGEQLVWRALNAVTLGVENHFVVTSDGTNYHIYRDGLEISSSQFSKTGTVVAEGDWVADLVFPPVFCAIGARRRSTTDNFMNGVLDDVRLYNRALTPSEVLSLYQEPFLEFEDEDDLWHVLSEAVNFNIVVPTARRIGI